ncbi:MAG TPA: Ig-like domain-containing protein [Gemmatimonadales bacterium]|nr:Ig-like domain-containing protein [Gemmatimonadales bacterium]
MSFARWNRLPALGVGLLLLACGGDGGGGGTGPPGPPAQLAKSGGDAQSWYFNNALPNPYSVTVRDANNRTVPGVSVDWGITTGGGSLSPDPSTTNSSGVATTVHTLGMATQYVVTATVTGLPSVTFTATASAPPPTAAVSLSNSRFDPSSVVVKVNQGTAGVGEVTWTWNDGATLHNVTFAGAGPPGGDIPNRNATGAPVTRTFNAVGTYNYTCTLHAGMNGTVTVVN